MTLAGKEKTLAFQAEKSDQLEAAWRLLAECSLCPRGCGVNRLEDETGFCGLGRDVLVASASPHFGEEAPLVGASGSGTIFLSGCNLGCVFCQNYDISHYREGYAAPVDKLVELMLGLERGWGCHNVNFVTPTHCTAHLMKAIAIARDKGLEVPIVYNCGGYEALETLRLLEGFVEIYMPDAKYARSDSAERYSHAADYPERMKQALLEMHRQVGDLVIERGIARRGLLVRHLVMPNDVAGSIDVIDFLADEVSSNTYVNVMAQYRPCHEAAGHRDINRRPTAAEITAAYRHAVKRGLRLAR